MVMITNDWVGRIVDHKFPLLELLDSSEKSSVFRTELPGPQPQKAAIKLITGDGKDALTSLASWELASGLSQPHLLRVFTAGRCQVAGVDLVYVVMELHEQTLSQIIPIRPLTATETGEMLEPVLDALGYLHAKDLVHGHVRPSNIVVVHEQVKLTADGLSRSGATKTLPLARDVFNAPELSVGPLTPAADIWSLGITLVESLTQRRPVVYSTENADPLVQETLPPPFAEMARRCLRADPAQRATASQVKEILKPGPARPEPASEIDAVVPSEVAEPETRRTMGTMAKPSPMVIAAVAVVLLAIIVYTLSHSHKGAPSNPAQTPPSAAESAPVPSSPPASRPLPPSSSTTAATTGRGEVVKRVLPDVSENAMRTIRGKIDLKVRVNVDAAGNVSNAALDSRRGSRYFTTRALDAARAWKFRPAQKSGQPIPSEWILRFQFKRTGTQVDPAEVRP